MADSEQVSMTIGGFSGIFGALLGASSEMGDPILQSAILYFGLGEVHLDSRFATVVALLISSIIEELL